MQNNRRIWEDISEQILLAKFDDTVICLAIEIFNG